MTCMYCHTGSTAQDKCINVEWRFSIMHYSHTMWASCFRLMGSLLFVQLLVQGDKKETSQPASLGLHLVDSSHKFPVTLKELPCYAVFISRAASYQIADMYMKCIYFAPTAVLQLCINYAQLFMVSNLFDLQNCTNCWAYSRSPAHVNSQLPLYWIDWQYILSYKNPIRVRRR